MTDKMRCPLCGAQLKEGKDCFISCFETDCQCCDGFRKNVYQALIDGKKAQEKLNECQSILKEIEKFCRENYTYEEIAFYWR